MMNNSRKSIYVVPTLAILALVAVVAFWALPFSPVVAQSGNNTTQVAQRDIDVVVDGSGLIAPARTISLFFGAVGKVETLNVEIGDTVKAGDVLAELETENLALQVELARQGLIAQQANYNQVTDAPTELELAQANAGVAQAQAGLAQATLGQEGSAAQRTLTCAGLDSASDLLENTQEAYDDYVKAGYEADPNFLPDPDSQIGRGLRDAQTNYDAVVTQCDLAVAQSESDAGVEAARAALAQAEAGRDALLAGPTADQLSALEAQLRIAEIQLQQAEKMLSEARITAPYDGVVVSLSLVEGQLASNASPAVVIADNTHLHIDLAVDELDVSDITVGSEADITIDALSGYSVTGTVTRIDPISTLQQGMVTYTVRVQLDEVDEAVRMGMSADVEIKVGTLENVLVVPRRAIQRNNELGEYVVVQTENGTTPVAVKPGYSADGMIVVTGEISAGQTILVNTDR